MESCNVLKFFSKNRSTSPAVNASTEWHVALSAEVSARDATLLSIYIKRKFYRILQKLMTQN